MTAQIASRSDVCKPADASSTAVRMITTVEAQLGSHASGERDSENSPKNILIDSKPDVLDAFLATRKGKRIIGALSVAMGIAFLLTRRITAYSDDYFLRSQPAVAKYAAIIRQDALLWLGSVALILGTVYLVWSLFPIRL